MEDAATEDTWWHLSPTLRSPFGVLQVPCDHSRSEKLGLGTSSAKFISETSVDTRILQAQVASFWGVAKTYMRIYSLTKWKRGAIFGDCVPALKSVSQVETERKEKNLSCSELEVLMFPV
jgi:hypothetical protein